jgi:hypothetical protein
MTACTENKTEWKLAKEKIIDLISEFEKEWLLAYRFEPDKQYIGLSKLKKDVINYFADKEAI